MISVQNRKLCGCHGQCIDEICALKVTMAIRISRWYFKLAQHFSFQDYILQIKFEKEINGVKEIKHTFASAAETNINFKIKILVQCYIQIVLVEHWNIRKMYAISAQIHKKNRNFFHFNSFHLPEYRIVSFAENSNLTNYFP